MTRQLLIAVLALGTAAAQVDGNKTIFRDELLEQFVGTWKLTGTVRGRPMNHTVEARWVLNHQFLEIHERDNSDAAKSELWYEAIVLIGYDHMSERYVMHWNDVFGGRFSETLGYGMRSGNEIVFRLEYPDGPFQTMFRWSPEEKQWHWEMRTKNVKGEWEEFGQMKLALLPLSR